MARKEATSVSATGFDGPCASASARGPASEKPTMSAPEPMRASRREIWRFMFASLSSQRRAFDRAHDTGVSSAAAEILGKRVLDIGLARLFVFREESRRLHDHAVDAVAALGGLF